MTAIKWQTEYEDALEIAKVEPKPVLVDFFNPQ